MKIRTMVQTALATAVICILSPFTIMLPFSPVPVSLSIFAILIAVYALGMKGGIAATALYIMIGFIGIPVFSGFSSGVGKLLSPTGGYIIGYLFVAFLSGIFIDRWESRGMHALGMILGIMVCYLFGTLWLAREAVMDYRAALAAGVIPFIPADAVKVAIALFAGPKLKRAVEKINASG